MKTVVLIFIVLMLTALLFAEKVNVYLIGTSEDEQGQKLLQSYKEAIIATDEIAIADSLEDGMFIITYVTLDPLKNSLIASDIGTIYSLTVSYMYGGYPITINTYMGCCPLDTMRKDAVEQMVENTINIFNEGIEGYPDLFEDDSDN